MVTGICVVGVAYLRGVSVCARLYSGSVLVWAIARLPAEVVLHFHILSVSASLLPPYPSFFSQSFPIPISYLTKLLSCSDD